MCKVSIYCRTTWRGVWFICPKLSWQPQLTTFAKWVTLIAINWVAIDTNDRPVWTKGSATSYGFDLAATHSGRTVFHNLTSAVLCLLLAEERPAEKKIAVADWRLIGDVFEGTFE